MMNRRLFLLAIIGSLAMPVAAQVKLTGTVSEWYGGTPTQSPQKRALVGVTVVAGVNLDCNTGQSGSDQIRGKVTAKVTTDASGKYTLSLPTGKFTIIYWKEGYVPQVDSQVASPGVHDVEISKDKGMQGLHRNLTFQ